MNHPFHLIIKPVGDQCNLNCTYCFYKEKSQQGSVMTLDTLERLTQHYINEQPDTCKEVQFVWQGGEPMMAGLEFYQAAVSYQQKYKRKGMSVTNAIQTNATLITDRWLRFLKANNFHVGISIDGTAPVHDSQRIYYSGKPSHEKVIDGYKRLKSANILTNILCVVHDGNVSYGRELYTYFTSTLGAKQLQFLPVVGTQSIDADLWGVFLVEVFDAWQQKGLGTVSIQLFDASYARIVQGIETFCVHAHECGNQLAAERNGDIFSCDHFVDSKHHIGNIHSSNFATMLSRVNHQDFVEASTSQDIACRSCEIKGLCQGGCPKHRDQHGKNKLCSGYYHFFTYSIPYFYAFGECIRRDLPIHHYRRFLPAIPVKTA